MHSASSKSAFDYSEEFAHVLALIEDAQSIALSGHTSPDGDALGSVLGLGLAIQKRYPEKQVAFLLADDAPVPRIYRFLAGSDSLVPACRYTDTPDLFISVDCPVLDRLADAAGVAKRAHTSVCFDHHPARTEFADVVVRCVGAAAVAVLIGTFLAELQFDISPEIGTCLLCGIVTDTGRFQYQNANADAFYVASYLVGCGQIRRRLRLRSTRASAWSTCGLRAWLWAASVRRRMVAWPIAMRVPRILRAWV